MNIKKLPNYIIPVDNKLYRGRAIYSPLTLYKMKKNDIKQIVDLRNTNTFSKCMERLFCKLFGIQYVNYKYPTRTDKIPDRKVLDSINSTIMSFPQKTYLHCTRGKRRTGVVAAYYEQQCLNKSDSEIVSNMFEHGFENMFKNNKRARHYFSTFMQFSRQYLD